jgi:hypothetical protein
MAKAARKSGDGESIMGYFRPILEENRKLLKNRRNDELYDRWLKDHPEHKEVPEQVKNGLSNLKTALRKKYKIGKGKGKRGQKAAAAPAGDGGAAPVKRAARGAAGQLERLEEQIDECMALARDLDREGLSKVIGFLRGARNQVVVQAGR